MGRPFSKYLTEREAQIMNVLWDLGSATAEEVREAIPLRLHNSTIRTKLRVLEAKGYVKHGVRGITFIFRPIKGRTRAQRKAVTELIKRFFGGSPNALVLHMLEEDYIDANRLNELRKTAKSGSKKRGRKKAA